ncbi:peptidoglycan-binding protein [Streptomyces sp. NPDC058676]|uniref:peptidoglycan-binding domain-containing protein n=1 Tax=unclassified Streptomyces TaxID=2593676 RepID=UPI00364B5F0F
MRPKTTPGTAPLTRTRRRLALAGLTVALTATLAGVAPVAQAATYSCSGRQYYLYDQYNAYYGTVVPKYAEYGYSTTVTYVPTYNAFSNQTIEAQCLLKDIGYGLTADGIYGSSTKAAVKDFQADMDLPADGFAGPQTWPLLRVAASD